MKEMTKANLSAAFAGESQAHMKYMAFADQAEREGLPNIARLFRAASYAEQMHATAHLRVLGGINATAQNLATAQGGEDFEIQEMYPAYLSVANLQEERAAVVSMDRALQAEKVHSQLYGQAKQAAEAKKDIDLTAIYVCETCGFTIESATPPERCPVCGSTRLRKF